MYVTYDNLLVLVLMIVVIVTLVKSFYDQRKKVVARSLKRLATTFRSQKLSRVG